ncbi:cold-shock' DNA-binding domain-containing protein [Dichotomocladium elegans]|nr:cold-shock' DNA-binding domain-containing protein [Dichotomocladium elegans]
MESPPRKTGRVKFFNSTKGYGFIIPHDQEGQPNIEEVFVHHTAIHNAGGFKSLSEGEEVEYDLVQGPKGMQAANVTGPGGAPVRGNPTVNYARNNFEIRYNGYPSATGDQQQQQQQHQPLPQQQYGYPPSAGPAPMAPYIFPQYYYHPYPPSPSMMMPAYFVPPNASNHQQGPSQDGASNSSEM